ncbi:hypothetical protein NP233_g9207 [Leucocoprinus birnbaumii]|uniref:Uncharacterized protein n=1 Tax=Leucocoprinus birnbaumii TaxID=56174 RepID=A0AAD5YT24_9AGAR|nr:hypothetical protein NP233_g9207 [Leucocoprinus birnbaumii]
MGLQKHELKWIKKYKEVCMNHRLTNPNFVMAQWAREFLAKEYLKEYNMQPDPKKFGQLYNWIRNACKISDSDGGHNEGQSESDEATDDSESEDKSNGEDSEANGSNTDSDMVKNYLSPRLRGFRAVVIARKIDTIKEVVNAGRSEGGSPPSPQDYFSRWNAAVSKIIQELSDEDRVQYQKEAEENEKKIIDGPTIEEVYSMQKHLVSRASELLLGLLGWEKKQFGDALFFVSAAYRNQEDKVCIQRFFVSNTKDYNRFKQPLLKKYDAHVANEMATIIVMNPAPDTRQAPELSGLVSMVNGKPLLNCSEVDDKTPNEIKAGLRQYIELLWKTSNPTRDVPWHALENPGGFMNHVLDQPRLRSFPGLNPDKLNREENLKLAMELSEDPDLLVFRECNSQGESQLQAGPKPFMEDEVDDEPSPAKSSTHAVISQIGNQAPPATAITSPPLLNDASLAKPGSAANQENTNTNTPIEDQGPFLTEVGAPQPDPPCTSISHLEISPLIPPVQHSPRGSHAANHARSNAKELQKSRTAKKATNSTAIVPNLRAPSARKIKVPTKVPETITGPAQGQAVSQKRPREPEASQEVEEPKRKRGRNGGKK